MSKRKFFEYNRPELFPAGHSKFGHSSWQRWRGPYLRLGRYRFKVEKNTTRFEVETVPDRVQWSFIVYKDTKFNTFVRERD